MCAYIVNYVVVCTSPAPVLQGSRGVAEENQDGSEDHVIKRSKEPDKQTDTRKHADKDENIRENTQNLPQKQKKIPN